MARITVESALAEIQNKNTILTYCKIIAKSFQVIL